MFQFLQTLTPAQIAGGVLAGGLILGGMVYVHRRYSRHGPSVDEGGTEPATSVVYLNSANQKHPLHPTQKSKRCLP
ncbi:hypothetical protein J6590_035901 [Homalodisca vitripennis]|nr:hypothetical protein J6590_035901 [Homalodisca vitripennis]